jgi:hypothetical protein
MTPKIQVYLKDIATGDIFELPFTSINYIEELDVGQSASFTLDFISVKAVADTYNTNVQDLFTATMREIYITMDGDTIWSGVISEYNRTKAADATFQLTVAAIDYFALLQKRRTGLTTVSFSAVDPATIPWALINASQTLNPPYSDFGITEGATDTTGLSVSIDYKNAELRQEIINLSNAKQLGSFDFDIDYTKKFNVYFPTKGTVRPEIVLDDNNILADSVKIPVALNLTNSIFVMGQGINNDVASANRIASAGYLTAYKLLEDSVSDNNISDPTLLDAAGDRFLALNEAPLYQVTIKTSGDEPDIRNYGVGDTLIVNVPEEGLNYAEYRVKKRTVDIDVSGQLIVQLDMLLI